MGRGFVEEVHPPAHLHSRSPPPAENLRYVDGSTGGSSRATAVTDSYAGDRGSEYFVYAKAT